MDTPANSATVVLLRRGAQCVMLARRIRKSAGSDVLQVFLPDAWLALQPSSSLAVKQVGYYGVQFYLLECYPATVPATTVPVCEA